MGMALYIHGIRKLCDEEKRELTGKSIDFIMRSDLFRRFSPRAPYNAGYWCCYEEEFDRNGFHKVKHMFTPVTDDKGEVYYVAFRENLAGYYYKSPESMDLIDRFLDETRPYRDPDDEYHVVSYDFAAPYFRNRPTGTDPEQEIFVYIYG